MKQKIKCFFGFHKPNVFIARDALQLKYYRVRCQYCKKWYDMEPQHIEGF